MRFKLRMVYLTRGTGSVDLNVVDNNDGAHDDVNTLKTVPILLAFVQQACFSNNYRAKRVRQAKTVSSEKENISNW